MINDEWSFLSDDEEYSSAQESWSFLGEEPTEQPASPVGEESPSESDGEGELSTGPGTRRSRREAQRSASTYDGEQYKEEGFGTSSMRTLAYMGQELGKGVAAFGDLALNVADPVTKIHRDPVSWVRDKASRVLDGDWFPFEYETPLEDGYKEGLSEYYKKQGLNTEWLTARSSGERALGLLSENLGVGGSIKGPQMLFGALRNKFATESEKRAVKFLDELGKSELAAATVGAATGGVAHSMFEDPDSAEQAALLGNFLGAVTGSLKHGSIAYHGKKLASMFIRGGDDVTAYGERMVMQDAAKMLKGADLEVVQQRFKIMMEIKDQYPEFHPTMYSVVQTPLAKHYQAITDLDNPEIAMNIYAKNRGVLRQIISDYGTRDKTGDSFHFIKEAMDQTYSSGQVIAHQYAERIARLEESINTLGRSRSTTEPAAVADDMRAEIVKLRDEARNHIEQLYNDIDPENLIQFSTTLTSVIPSQALASTLKALSTREFNPRSPDAHLTARLLEITKDMKPKKTTNDFGESVVDESSMEMSFNKLLQLRKDIGRIQRDAKDIKGTNEAHSLAENLNRNIDEFLEQAMGHQSPTLSSAEHGIAKEMYHIANDTYKQYYLPFFREDNSELRKIIERTSTGTEYKIKSDDILAKFWSSAGTGKEFGAKQINDMLTEISDIVDPDLLEAARKAIDVHLTDHAANDLHKAIRRSSDPTAAYKKWVADNEVNLKNFPEVKDRIDEIGEVLSELSLDRALANTKLSEIHSNISKKYFDADPETLLNNLVKGTEYQTVNTVRELFYGAGLRTPGDTFPSPQRSENIKEVMKKLELDIQATSKTNPQLYQELSALRRVISNETVADILRKSVDNAGDGSISPAKLRGFLNGTNDTFNKGSLEAILTPEDKALLTKFKVLAEGTDTGFSVQGKLDFDILSQLEKEFGISLPSISSRVYAQQLGKVGPIFIVTDTGVKLFRAFHRKAMKDRLREVVYDLDALEKVMETRRNLDTGVEQEIATEVVNTTKLVRSYISKNAAKIKNGEISPAQMFKDLMKELGSNAKYISPAFKFESYLEERNKLGEGDSSDFTRDYSDLLMEVYDDLGSAEQRSLESLGLSTDTDAEEVEESDVIDFEYDEETDTLVPINWDNYMGDDADMSPVGELDGGEDVGSIRPGLDSNEEKVWSTAYNASTALGIGREASQNLADLSSFVFTLTPSGDADLIHTGGKKISEGDTKGGLVDIAMGSLPVLPDLGKAIFAGVRSMRGTSQGKGSSSQLEGAISMETSGVPSEEIRQTTGWERDASGRWNYEIDDSQARLTLEVEGKPGEIVDETSTKLTKVHIARDKYKSLGDILDHPELYRAYPELKDIHVYRTPLFSWNIAGSYDPVSRNIFLAGFEAPATIKKTLMHEIQHAVQHIEGFPNGANVGEFLPANFSEAQKVVREARDAFDKKVEQTTGIKSINEFSLASFLDYLKTPQKRAHHYKDTVKQLKDAGLLEDAVKVSRGIELVRGIEERAYSQYKAVQGEVQARNVEARMGMSADERVITSPQSTEDVARDKQISPKRSIDKVKRND
jgi:hypothetical protein